ncbi:MAG: hypothetical protein NTZ10_04340 [Candidatus Saganbacteria bacterium]|nr:hypothetical protein [Candidatus Saganbacteria bacterium]
MQIRSKNINMPGAGSPSERTIQRKSPAVRPVQATLAQRTRLSNWLTDKAGIPGKIPLTVDPGFKIVLYVGQTSPMDLYTFNAPEIIRNGVIVHPVLLDDCKAAIFWSVNDRGAMVFPFQGYIFSDNRGKLLDTPQSFRPFLEKFRSSGLPGAYDLNVCQLIYWLGTGNCQPDPLPLKVDKFGIVYLYALQKASKKLPPVKISMSGDDRLKKSGIEGEPVIFKDKSRGLRFWVLADDKKTREFPESAVKLFTGDKFIESPTKIPLGLQEYKGDLPKTEGIGRKHLVYWLITGESRPAESTEGLVKGYLNLYTLSGKRLTLYIGRAAGKQVIIQPTGLGNGRRGLAVWTTDDKKQKLSLIKGFVLAESGLLSGRGEVVSLAGSEASKFLKKEGAETSAADQKNTAKKLDEAESDKVY